MCAQFPAFSAEMNISQTLSVSPIPFRPLLSEVQCVLLADMLVLLQKQDDKMVLKCQSKSNIAVQEGKQMLSPIIRLDSAFPREVATGQYHTEVQLL